MVPTARTVDRVRFTLLHWGRPQWGKTLTLAALDGAALRLDVAPRTPRKGVLRECWIRLDLLAAGLPPAPEGAVPAEMVKAVESVHRELLHLAGNWRGSAWAVEAWASLPGEDGPDAWSYVMMPWTIAVRPCREPVPGHRGAGYALRWWESRTRTGAGPWPSSWPAVRTVGGAPQPPRFADDAHWTLGFVDLAPPAPDFVVAPAGARP